MKKYPLLDFNPLKMLRFKQFSIWSMCHYVLKNIVYFAAVECSILHLFIRSSLLIRHCSYLIIYYSISLLIFKYISFVIVWEKDALISHNDCEFCFIYFKAILFCAHKLRIIVSFWNIKLFIIMNYPSLSMIILRMPFHPKTYYV